MTSTPAFTETAETVNGRTIRRFESGTRAAALWLPVGSERFTVYFGFMDGDRFRCSYAKPSRTYATEKTAERIAKKWILEG